MANSLFQQNVIAVIWDFDKTLSPDYMQKPLFRKFNVKEKAFFAESNGLAAIYKADGVANVSKDLVYLNHILTYVRQGQFKGLNNAMLFELGREIEFYDGLPEFFQRLKDDFSQTRYFKEDGITIEHYIVSTGLRQMIMGSHISPYVVDVWGCEFFESVAEHGYLEPDSDGHKTIQQRIKSDRVTREGVIQGIAYSIDSTSKTRALFEISKGTNKNDNINVNAKLAQEDRRIPFRNMIYIADGPSDIPVFSIVGQYGGRTFAVYKPKSREHFREVVKLQRDQRVQAIGEATYVEGSLSAMWITNAAEEIAERMTNEREALLKDRIGVVPQHIVSDAAESAVADDSTTIAPSDESAAKPNGGVVVESTMAPESRTRSKRNLDRFTVLKRAMRFYLGSDSSSTNYESVLREIAEEFLQRVPDADYAAFSQRAGQEYGAENNNRPLTRKLPDALKKDLLKLLDSVVEQKLFNEK